MFQSLRARLIGICVTITALSLLALAVPAFLLVRSNTLESLDQRIHQLTQVYAGELTEWVKEKQRITSSIKAAVPQSDPVPALLAAIQAGAFDDAYFVFANKRHVFSHPMPENYDGTARPWYQQAVREGKATLTPAYVDASTSKLTISFVEPVVANGQTVAVVGTDMHLETVSRKVTSIQPTPKSFAFLLDGQGNILAHAQADLVLKPMSALAPALTPALIEQLTSQGQSANVTIGDA